MKRRDFPLALAGIIAGCKSVAAPQNVGTGSDDADVSMGVSVFSGWANPRPEYGKVPGVQCPWEYPWESLKTDDRVPLMGKYDERELAITEKRCEMMEYGRIGFACYQVEMAA